MPLCVAVIPSMDACSRGHDVDVCLNRFFSTFARRARIERKRMDVGLHQFAERCVDGPMARQRRESVERRADDAHTEMAAAVARAGMADVAMAFVLDIELERS